jgi:hypothetical protein
MRTTATSLPASLTSVARLRSVQLEAIVSRAGAGLEPIDVRFMSPTIGPFVPYAPAGARPFLWALVPGQGRVPARLSCSRMSQQVARGRCCADKSADKPRGRNGGLQGRAANPAAPPGRDVARAPGQDGVGILDSPAVSVVARLTTGPTVIMTVRASSSTGTRRPVWRRSVRPEPPVLVRRSTPRA